MTEPKWTTISPFLTGERAAGTGIPHSTTPLIGREREVTALAALLRSDEVRLISLTGPGGVGKTRLALRMAMELADDEVFADGAAFVSLASVVAPGLVAATIAQALDIHEMSDRPAAAVLQAALREQALLLTLDNFEHLLPAAPLISELLAGCPKIKILVTSRTRLRLTGERDVPVFPLALPDPTARPPVAALTEYAGIRLFVERARAANPGFTLNDANAAAVAVICQRLDGLPLAIELAAARCRVLSAPALLTRLGKRLWLLTDGPRDQPARLQTMRQAIAWSYEQLEDGERQLLRRLAVFTGGGTVDAAEWMMADSSHALSPRDAETAAPTALELITSLLDQSLLSAVTDASGEPRFVMFETIREYALEELTAHGTEAVVRDTHAAYFLNLAETAEPELMGPDPLPWFKRLEADIGNLRTALDWLRQRGEITTALRLAGALAWFWTDPAYVAEGRAWLEMLLALPGTDVPLTIRAKALGAAGDLADWQTDTASAKMLNEAALALWREVGDVKHIAATLRSLGSAAIDQHRPAEAASVLAEALALARQVGDTWNAAAAANLLGLASLLLGDHAQAEALHLEALQLWRGIGDLTHAAVAMGSLAWALVQGGGVQAGETLDAALTLAMETDDAGQIALCLAGCATLAAVAADPVVAVQLFAAAAKIREELKLPLRPPIQAVIDDMLSRLNQRLDHPSFTLAWAAGRGLTWEQAIALARASRSPAEQLVSAALPPELARLSGRELDVLRLLAAGYADKDIASALFISRRTASKHVAAILEKLAVTNRTAAAALAVRHGFNVSSPPLRRDDWS